MSTDYQRVLDSIKDLPPMPVVATKVLKQMQDPDYSARALAQIIATDSGLSAQLLRLANSAFFGVPRQIQSLDKAVIMVGEKGLRNMALAASLKGMNRSFGLLEKMLWEDSIGCAIGARLAARTFRVCDPEEAFLGGLFRHIGKIVMDFAEPEKFQTMIQAAYNGEGSLGDLEGQYFSYSHAVIGAAVLKKWGLSDRLILSTLHHARADLIEEDDPAVFRLAATVNLAGGLCQRLGIGQRRPDEGYAAAGNPGLSKLQLTAEDFDSLCEELQTSFAETRELFL